MLNKFSLVSSGDFETLGIDAVHDTQSCMNGRIPVPIFLDAQIEELWIKKMQKLKKKTLWELHHMICNLGGRSNWFLAFLTQLLLIYNVATLYRDHIRFIYANCVTVRSILPH